MLDTFKKYLLPERNGFHCLAVHNVPKSLPPYGHILIRVKAASLNWRDLAIAKGIYAFPGTSCDVPGSDGAGRFHLYTLSYSQ